MKKILVVDDEADVRTAIACTLEDIECQLIEADNGAAAYDCAVSEKPDLIISDVMMDNGNGFALMELLKRDSRTASIKVIMITGAAHYAGAWQSDPNARYLLKPFSADEILAEVKEILND
ncbi:MAG TPA: response regulator [Bacteroidota bacterium]|nr:response regulator [Bacteroidota bacterium]